MMCWIIPLLVGLLSALLGYLLGKRCSGNTEVVTRLTEENSTLRANLNDCEAQKAQFITDSENLLAQHKGESTAKTAGFSAITSSDSDSKIANLSDSDIEQHAVYQTLLSKYEAIKSEKQEKNNHSSAKLSDESVTQHKAFIELQQTLEQSKTDYHTLQEDFDRSEQQNAQTASMISDLRAENQRISHALKTQQTETNDEIASLKTKLDSLTTDNSNLSKDLKQCQSDLSQAKKVTDHKITNFATGAVAKTFDAAAAKAVFGKKIKENDLTVVEGIGPKISQLFIDAGIATWQALGETKVEHCQKILDDAGDRYTVHNPGTWPRQAKLAADGEWQKLLDWQEKLDGGKE